MSIVHTPQFDESIAGNTPNSLMILFNPRSTGQVVLSVLLSWLFLLSSIPNVPDQGLFLIVVVLRPLGTATRSVRVDHYMMMNIARGVVQDAKTVGSGRVLRRFVRAVRAR